MDFQVLYTTLQPEDDIEPPSGDLIALACATREEAIETALELITGGNYIWKIVAPDGRIIMQAGDHGSPRRAE